ncbi:hypothetical protein [Nonomuraea sp. NPDC050786]
MKTIPAVLARRSRVGRVAHLIAVTVRTIGDEEVSAQPGWSASCG